MYVDDFKKYKLPRSALFGPVLMPTINETILLKLFQWSCELLQNEIQAFHKSFSLNDTNYTLTSSIFSRIQP